MHPRKTHVALDGRRGVAQHGEEERHDLVGLSRAEPVLRRELLGAGTRPFQSGRANRNDVRGGGGCRGTTLLNRGGRALFFLTPLRPCRGSLGVPSDVMNVANSGRKVVSK